jgi:hypothetical protein
MSEQAMPVDLAPGSDGFNGLFLKKCWSILKNISINWQQTFKK